MDEEKVTDGTIIDLNRVEANLRDDFFRVERRAAILMVVLLLMMDQCLVKESKGEKVTPR